MRTEIKFVVRLKDKKDFIHKIKVFIECFEEFRVRSIISYNHKNLIAKHVMDSKDKGSSADNIISLIKKEKDYTGIYLHGDFLIPQHDTIKLTVDTEKVIFTWESDSIYFFKDSLAYVDKQKVELKHKELQKKLFIVLKKVVEKLDPRSVMLFTGNEYEESLAPWFEYHDNPYLFCIEGDPENLKNIKEIMPENELIEIIKKQSKEVIKGKKGIGVVRNISGSYSSFACPAYFIRKELRKKGLKLKSGRTEEMVKEGIVVRPDIMKKIGVIDEKIQKKIEETKKTLTKEKPQDFYSIFEKVIEKALTKEELTELGLNEDVEKSESK